MNIPRRLTVDSSSDSDHSDATENSVENGKHCVVRFIHREFIFERQIFLNTENLLPTGSIKLENSDKTICLPTCSNNNLYGLSDDKVNAPYIHIDGVLNLTSLYRETLKAAKIDELINLGRGIDFSCAKESTDKIEFETRYRLSNENCLWKELQIGRISGFVFKEVCQSQSKYPSKQLMNRIFQIYKEEDRSAIWLKKNFITVRTKYERIKIKQHVNFVYRKCGLVLKADHPQFCVTPGGIVECDCCGRGTCEFYCPYEIRNEKMIYSLPCLCEKDDYDFDLQKSSNFYYKIQLHMLLTDTDYCDFVVWTTCDYLDIRIKRDNDFLFVHVNSAKTFFLRKILPDILTNDYSDR